MYMVTAHNSSFSFLEKRGGRKGVLPYPLFMSAGIFFIESVGQVNGTKARGEVFFMNRFYLLKMLAKRSDKAVG